MKKTKIALLGFAIVFSTTSYSQMDREYFLKNYKSPEFSLKSLRFVGAGNTSGGMEKSPNFEEYHNGSFQGHLHYSTFTNRENYQGNQRVGSNLSFRYAKSQVGKFVAGTAHISYYGENRFYLKENLFLGVHSKSSIWTVVSKNLDSTSSDGIISTKLNPAISLGFGRVEYAYFARQAMDIDRMLIKSGSSSSHLNETQLKQLADRIGELRNTRAFDGRLLRIKQLEQIDSLIETFGVLNTRDMSYFAALNDAYYFSNFADRRSGFRAELGLTEMFDFDKYPINGTSWSNASLGFLKVEYFLPKSYMIQHDFAFQIYGGQTRRMNDQGLNVIDFPLWANLAYSFGIYPNTRTNLRLGVNADYSISTNEEFGFAGGINLSYYYYLSPATRLRISGEYVFYESYDYDNNLAGLNYVSLNPPLLNQKYAFLVSLVHNIF